MTEETKTPRDEKLTQNFLTDKWGEKNHDLNPSNLPPESRLLIARKYFFLPSEFLSLSLNLLLYKREVMSLLLSMVTKIRNNVHLVPSQILET